MNPEIAKQFDDLLNTGEFVIIGDRIYSKRTSWSADKERMLKLAEETNKSLVDIAVALGVYHEPIHESHTALKCVDLGGR